MEETQNQTEVNEVSEVSQMTPPQSTNLSIDQKQKKGSSKWVLIFIALLILGGAGIFFFTKSSNTEEANPTPTFESVPFEDTFGDTETPSPEPVVKADISIEIQNGTGLTGEAKYLQDKLELLGYTDIVAKNAATTDNTDTVVTFLKDTSQTVQDEITKELEKIYKKVVVKTSTTQDVNILIVTGLRTGQTAKPSPTATASPTATSTASPSASPTAI